MPISLNVAGGDSSFTSSDPPFRGCTEIKKVTFTKGTGEGFNYSNYQHEHYNNTPWKIATGNVTVIFEEGITSIGNNMFNGCSKLQMVEFPSTLTTIKQSAFSGCTGMVGKLNLIEGITTIETSAFYGCSGLNGTLEFPSTVTKLNDDVFHGCEGIEKMIIHEGITRLGKRIFYGCSGLKELVVPISLNVAGGDSSFTSSDPPFRGCTEIKKVTFTKGTGEGFNYSNYQHEHYNNTPWKIATGNITVIFEEGITSIGNNMFNGCSKLQMVEFPSTLTTIKQSAFSGCTGMVGKLNLIEGITTIETSAFYGCSGLNGTLEFPSTVTKLNDDVFHGCEGIEKIIIHEGITSFGKSSFSGCSGLQNLVLPISLSTASFGSTSGSSSYYAPFLGCTGIKKVTFTKGTGEGFNYTNYQHEHYTCTPWKIATGNVTVVFEEGIKSIGTNTFRDLSGATFYYKGSEEEWNKITISSGNTSLTTPSFNYNE